MKGKKGNRSGEKGDRKKKALGNEIRGKRGPLGISSQSERLYDGISRGDLSKG